MCETLIRVKYALCLRRLEDSRLCPHSLLTDTIKHTGARVHLMSPLPHTHTHDKKEQKWVDSGKAREMERHKDRAQGEGRNSDIFRLHLLDVPFNFDNQDYPL